MVFKSRSNLYPGSAISIGKPVGEVASMAMMSNIVGLRGPKGRTIVLVAEHQKLRAADTSSRSKLISMVESLMALKMPKDLHSSPKYDSIQVTQAAQAEVVKGQTP
ncbi:hypothetical protein ACFX1W_012515 [Malus domestica]